MELYIQKNESRTKIRFTGTVNELLKQHRINPETVIVTRNGKLVTDDSRLGDKDEVEVLQVVSGG